MRPDIKILLSEISEDSGLTPEEFCVRAAKKLKVQRRIIVRRRGGGLRIVEPGARLRLDADEFIANVPPSMTRRIVAESRRRRMTRDDLD